MFERTEIEQLNVWTDYEEGHGYFYGSNGEGKCYRIALSDKNGVQVGQEAPYESFAVSRQKSQPWKKFGLVLRIKKVKEYSGPRAKTKDEHTTETVIMKYFDARGEELVGFEKDRRALYSNTKGRYIKTRASGRVYLTLDEPPTVHYHGRRPVPPRKDS